MPRKAPTQITEMRMTMGNFERSLVTEIKTDIEKSIKIATIGAVAVPVTLGVGLIGGMGFLGYGLYQGLSSFGFGNITDEIGKELKDAKNNAWCWWTNKNRKFWGLDPVDCKGDETETPPSRREKERSEAEQLEYLQYREDRRKRTEQREAAQREKYNLTVEEQERRRQQYLDEETVFEHTSRPGSETDEEAAMRAARAAEAAERRAQEKAETDEQNRAERAKRIADREAAAAAAAAAAGNQEDDDGDPGGSQYGGGSSASGNDTNNDGDPDREGDGTAPSRQREGSNRGGRS
tara:strand:- start:594 stop:1472 length:879 start_codon:yes stop_codon:yes gene_type:complete